MQAAVDSCTEAFQTWSQMTALTRQQIMFKYQALIKRDMVRCSEEGARGRDFCVVSTLGDLNVVEETFF